MKKNLLALAIFCLAVFTNVFAYTNAHSYQSDVIQQQRQDGSFDFMMSELARVHKALYALPYDYEYIRETLMPEVVKMRSQVSPHYPNRSDFGEDQEEAMRQFRNWYETYPGEWKAYVSFVDQYVEQHKN